MVTFLVKATFDFHLSHTVENKKLYRNMQKNLSNVLANSFYGHLMHAVTVENDCTFTVHTHMQQHQSARCIRMLLISVCCSVEWSVDRWHCKILNFWSIHTNFRFSTKTLVFETVKFFNKCRVGKFYVFADIQPNLIVNQTMTHKYIMTHIPVHIFLATINE